MPTRLPSKSWSSTLKLPKSTFPPRPILAEQSKYLKRCSDDLYEWQSRQRSAQRPFVLHDGPPYANGKLHVGHALNKILKDIICRVKVQQGRRVVYVPGWDCHGLPIEIKALERKRKELGEGKVLSPVEVRVAARTLATEAVADQMKSFQVWGVMADWGKAWKTMDRLFEMEQLQVFQEMTKAGLIFRRHKPVYWSPSSKTALAEAELEYKNDHESAAAYVKFPLLHIPDILKSQLPRDGQLSAVIWTTTPWTLPGNRAIAVHSELDYSVIRIGIDLLLIATSRVPSVLKQICEDESYEYVVDSITGKDLVGAEYVNVLREQGSGHQPIIHADFVSAESGSGLVHLAPGHGMDDYEVCTRLGIDAESLIDDRGCFTSAIGPKSGLEGLPIGTADMSYGTKEIIKVLGADVLSHSKHKHKYPYDWRTKEPVIIRATEQWFADVGHIKNNALQALTDVRFIPDSGRSRLESFVRGRSEWCISRQRAWGVPIPALYHNDGTTVLTDESVAHIISVIKDRGIDSWWTDAEDDAAWIAPGLSKELRRGTDTMDVWFDSGTSWTQTEQQADVYLEGTDQHRGWFQSSILTHIAASGKAAAPYKTLITHGFTLDQDGKKMSKSMGNVISPDEIIDGSLLPPAKPKKKSSGPISQALGPDALRLWVASSDYTHDVVIGRPTLQFNHSALLKYRVMLKMLLGSMHPVARTAPLTKLDSIALAQLLKVMKEVALAYDNFEFYKGVSAINRWINNDLSAFYLEAAKDRLYCGDGGGVVEDMFNGLLRMLTPITPHLVEEAWDHRPEWIKAEAQVHPFHKTLDEPLTSIDRNRRDPQLLEDLAWLLNANTAIKTAQEEARVDKLIGSSLEASVVLELPAAARKLFDQYADELEAIFVVSSVTLADTNVEAEAAWTRSSSFDAPGGRATAWVVPAKDHKCPRCWRCVAPAEEELCARCEDIVGSVS